MFDHEIVVDFPLSGICLLRLNRPGRLNALSLPMVHSIHEVLDRVLEDREVRALVITGTGRGFCAGLDLESVTDQSGQYGLTIQQSMDLQDAFSSVIRRLRDSNTAVIAAVNGVGVGAGMALALATDIRIASHQASFHVGAVKIGITAGECGISYHLPRLVGAGRAFEVMLTGRVVASEEAERIGLVSAVVPQEQLIDHALQCASSILANPPYSSAQTKRVMWRNVDAMGLDAAIELEDRMQVIGLMTEDFKQAITDFKSRRDRPARK